MTKIAILVPIFYVLFSLHFQVVFITLDKLPIFLFAFLSTFFQTLFLFGAIFPFDF